MSEIGTATVRVRWNGAAVRARVAAAAVIGVDQTLAACVVDAKSTHEYENRTGFMNASTTIFDWATWEGDRVSGKWGAHAYYALFLEIGTSRPWSGAPRAQVRAAEGHGDMWAIPPPQPIGPHTDTKWVKGERIPGTGPLMTERMSLRPAAAREYPLLAERISIAYRAGV